MTAMATISPFTRTVVEAMRTLYPEKYADKSFDNTGLLLASPLHPSRPRQRNSALLTVDLTTAVADEAIRRRDSIIIAYHPIIFRPLKSLTLTDTQQTSLLRLAQEGISVYSPHTAVDASPGGMGDWLCDVVTGCYPPRSGTGADEPNMSPDQTGYMPVYPNPRNIGAKQAPQIEHTRETIHPSQGQSQCEDKQKEPGMGRLVTLNTAQPLRVILEHIANGTGLSSSSGIPIAVPQSVTATAGAGATGTDTGTGTGGQSAGPQRDVGNIPIRTISVCPGSGGSVLLKTPSGEVADLIFTGEMSHHETLAAVERGSVVVALRHSNTERGFLHAVMRGSLEGLVSKEWARRGAEEGSILDERSGEVLQDTEAVVHVSEVDRDPFGVLYR